MRIERLLDKRLAPQVSDVIFRSFRNDPYSWAVARSPDATDGFLTYLEQEHIPLVLREANETPSVVAIEDDGRVIGALTAEDFRFSDESRFDEPVFSQAIPAILNACHDIFWRELYLRKGETKETAGRICYFAFLAVDPDVRRRRIGGALASASMEMVAKQGYRIGVAFCTSFRSTKIFASVGFQQWGEVRYHSFRLPVDGSIPFASLPDEGTTVMVKFFQRVR